MSRFGLSAARAGASVGAMAAEPTALGRVATEDDADAASACLASAFHDDPLWGGWAFPEESSRERLLRSLMGFWVAGGVRRCSLWMTAAAETVAVWVPPGMSEMSDAEEAGLVAFFERALAGRAGEVLALIEQFEHHRPRDQPHHYLSLWGTHRDHAGQGLGTALMHECLARIDAERMPAYLESTNPANLARYRELGFRELAEFGPDAGPRLTTMWRDAR